MENQLIKQTTCLNCEEPHQEGFKFCPNCGQNTTDKLTVGVLFYNTISNYISFDARFFKSFVPLMFLPGVLAKRFIEGKRLKYLHPTQMYLFVSVIFFFMISFALNDSVVEIDKSIKNSNTVIDEDVKLKKTEKNKEIKGVVFGKTFSEAKIDSLYKSGASDQQVYQSLGMNKDAGFLTQRFYHQGVKLIRKKGVGALVKTMYDSIPVSLFLLLPFFALFLKLFHRKKGNYVNHLVFSFYYFSYVFTLLILFYSLDFIFNLPSSFIKWLILLIMLYLVLALKQFYNQGVFKSILKIIGISFLFFIILIPFTVFITGIAFLTY